MSLKCVAMYVVIYYTVEIHNNYIVYDVLIAMSDEYIYNASLTSALLFHKYLIPSYVIVYNWFEIHTRL